MCSMSLGTHPLLLRHHTLLQLLHAPSTEGLKTFDSEGSEGSARSGLAIVPETGN